MERKKNIDEHLKHSLEELEVQPGIRSFHEIMLKMEEKKKRRRFIIFFWCSLLLFCTSVISLYYVFAGQKEIAVNESPSARTPSPITTETKFSNKNSLKSLKQEAVVTKDPENSPDHNINANSPVVKSETKNNNLKIISLKNKTEKNNLITTHKRTIKSNTVAVIKDTTATLNQKQETAKSTNIQTADLLFLPSITLQLPNDTIEKELVFISPDTIQQLSVSIPDSIKDTKKKIRFYFGVDIDPKLSSYVFLKNNNRNSVYNDGTDFANHYLKGRRNQNTFGFNYGFGLKAGLNIHNKYELFFGFGFQKYRQKEKAYDYKQPVPVPTNLPDQSLFADQSGGGYQINTFNYYYYSAEVNRIYKITSKINYKLGMGMQLNQLKSSYFIYASAPSLYYSANNTNAAISKWTYTANLRSGIMFNAGKRWQFQFCPTAFYSPASTFKKDYVIKQHPFGFSLECLLLFRLF